MTKKHFFALADALRASRPIPASEPMPTVEFRAQCDKRAQWLKDVSAIADVCEAQNPNFDRERWFKYVNT